MTGSDTCSLAFVRYLYDMGILTRQDKLHRYRPFVEILRPCSHCNCNYIVQLYHHRDKHVLYMNKCGAIMQLDICIKSLKDHYNNLVQVHREMIVRCGRNEYVKDTITRDMLIALAEYMTSRHASV